MPAAAVKGKVSSCKVLVLVQTAYDHKYFLNLFSKELFAIYGLKLTMAVHVGIILSISIITALGVAVLENPQIQAWLEQQRQKIAELLRSIGEELDPQSRQAAEAFAFEGKTPANDEGLRREASGSKEAAAVATGRSLSNASTIRRIPVRGPSDPDEAEERRRKGREYLAKRNQQMYELQQRRKAAKAEGATTPPSPTSFDSMVDGEGKLRLPEVNVGKGKEKELPSPPSTEPVAEQLMAKMKEVERNLKQSLLAEEPSSSSSGWQLGSHLANPFSDEYELDRSDTPKPPVPPKVALEADAPVTPKMPGSFTPRQPEPEAPQMEDGQEELSYEEQLAIALSLSEAEAANNNSSSATTGRNDADEEDSDLRAAIEQSLKDMASKDQTSTPRNGTALTQPTPEHYQPLVDLSPPSPITPLHQPSPRGHWESFFDQDYAPTREPLSMAQPAPTYEEEDELYRVTPQLTHARLAILSAQQSGSSSTPATMPYDPVRESATQLQEQPALMEASFYSAASTAPSPASTHTTDHVPMLVDVSDDVQPQGSRTPVSRSSFGFQTDKDSESDTFASVSASASRALSRARSEVSNVEVVDVLEDSDVDMLSEEGDGIKTPDSWTEVGSRDGESDMEDEQPRRIPIT